MVYATLLGCVFVKPKMLMNAYHGNPQVWIFYYQTHEQPYKKIEFGRGSFINPSRSKIHKKLMEKFNTDLNVKSVGYCLSEKYNEI